MRSNMRVFSPKAAVVVGAGVTDMQKRVLEDLVRGAGVKEVYLIDQPIAAAIGTDIDIMRPTGTMIVNIGAGACEIAVICLNSIVAVRTIETGGRFFDKEIISYLKKKSGICLGHSTAERIKKDLGALMEEESPKISICGKSVASAMPINYTVEAKDIQKAMMPGIKRIVEAIKSILMEVPQQLRQDIQKEGIVFTGAGAMVYGLIDLVSRETGVMSKIADNAATAAIEGTIRAIGIEYETPINAVSQKAGYSIDM
jgi:rod shape-determining protein MreB